MKDRAGKWKGLMGREYLVKYLGYPPAFNQWIVDDELHKAKSLVADYEQAKADLEKSKTASRRRGVVVE